MRHRTSRCVIGITLGLCLMTGPARAGSISTAEIVAAGTQFGCMAWRVSGVCFFLVCTPLGCEVETSIQVSHFSPDLVVTAYHTLGASPWREIRRLYGPVQVAANQRLYAPYGIDPQVGPGGGRFVEPHPNAYAHKNLIFKDAEVIGSPGSVATLAADLGLPLACPATQSSPGFPYFLSGLDTLAWRSTLTEQLYLPSWVPGLREVGTYPFNTWGSVYPRIGFIHHSEDPKAAAVVAQRAADIATREGQPHVYVPVGTVPGWHSDGQIVWGPGPVREHDPDNSRWQMLFPQLSSVCEAFGENDTLNVFDGWSANRSDGSGDTVWNLWRPYRCCDDLGVLLFVVSL